jgi:diacylglycerol kinase family enzyme
MGNKKIDVIATTISGSIKDWGKVKRIIPLFKECGQNNVSLFVVDRHLEARKKTTELIKTGSRIIISAGGSGTFNSILEGCLDSGINLNEIKLGFLRKGSADLIGKTLGMPDNIEEAIEVFNTSINEDKTVRCDIIQVVSEESGNPLRHFIGYGGAEIFGNIPYFTENRFIKYYKGVLSQLFGDLGPFFVGASLATLRKTMRDLIHKKTKWQVFVDGDEVSENYYQAMIIVNGDLGPDLPFAKSAPLGSGEFYLFAIRNKGLLKLSKQFKHAWDASIRDNPDKWGFESYTIKKSLKIKPDHNTIFPINVDGSTMNCIQSAMFKICNQINLISR